MNKSSTSILDIVVIGKMNSGSLLISRIHVKKSEKFLRLNFQRPNTDSHIQKKKKKDLEEEEMKY